jgi:type IV pilus assembly protein PilA
MKTHLKNKKGFTLIELIVVIAIIAILALILIPRFSGYADRARENAAKSDARNITMAVQVGLTEGKSSVTIADIETTLGITVNGRICEYSDSYTTGEKIQKDALPNNITGLTKATFIYFYPVNNEEYYPVKVNDGIITD